MEKNKLLGSLFAPLALFCLAAAPLLAGEGTAGGDFLRIVQSPRAVGMGEAGAGGYGDLLGALSLNPAGLARSGYKEAAFTYNSWIEGIASQQAAYAQPLGPGVIAGAVMALSVPSIDGYDNSGAYTGQVEAGNLAAGGSYAARVWSPWDDARYGLFAGATLKYARERLGGTSAGAPLADAGVLWIARAGGGTASLGLSGQSLGGGFKFDSETDPAPSVYRAGFSYIVLAAGDPITFSADVRKPDNSGASFSAGGEYQVWRTLALRAGYVSGQDLGSGLRFGGGVALKLLQFDYSLSSYGKFGPAHRFSLSYKFDKPVPVTQHLTVEQEQARRKGAEARAMMDEKRYYEAVLLLNDALTLDPGYKEALDLMKKARMLIEGPR